MDSRRSVWVTGAGGFVGQHLVAALRDADLEVTALTRQTSAHGTPSLDVTDRAAVHQTFRSAPAPDVVIHLAAIAHRKPRSITPQRYDEVNHGGTRHVLDAATEVGVRRLIFFSSVSVYGEVGRTAPLPEDADRRPVGPYAQSKRDAEDACFEAMARGLDCIILRFPPIYARKWLVDLRKRTYVPLMGQRFLLRVLGKQPRHSLCALEHTAGAVLLGVRGRLTAGAYNVSDGEPYTQHEIASVVGALDGISLCLPVPRAWVRGALMVISPAITSSLRASVWSNYWKFLEGVALDISKIMDAGFVPQLRLAALLGAEQ